MDNRIKVVDSYMGSGKTSYAIQTMNRYTSDTKVIYITPYLDEVSRIATSCPNMNFEYPDAKRGKGSKLADLIQLVTKGKNIVSTHALFSNISDELINVLRANNYVLFLDEVFNTVEKFSISDSYDRDEDDAITKQDIDTLLSKGILRTESDYRVKWNDESVLLSCYTKIKNLADRDLLYLVNGSLLMWSFPVEVFRQGIFSEIYILTHRFESQIQAYYYKYFELEYVKYCVYRDGVEYLLTQDACEDRELQWKLSIKDKIHIVDNVKLNKVGDVYYDSRNHEYKSGLSKTWYENHQDVIPIIRDNLTNYFVNVAKSRSSDRLWTCFKENVKNISSKNVSKKYWLAINARATNDYIDRTALAYLVNRYIDTFYDDFFEKKGISINQDEYALSEMLQWIFRSAVREEKDIQLYIPSQRMRTLLINYLKGDSIAF